MLTRRELPVIAKPSSHRWPGLTRRFSNIVRSIADAEFEVIALVCAIGWLATLWIISHVADFAAALETLDRLH